MKQDWVMVAFLLLSKAIATEDPPEDRLHRLHQYLVTEAAKFKLPAVAVTSKGRIAHEKVLGAGL